MAKEKSDGKEGKGKGKESGRMRKGKEVNNRERDEKRGKRRDSKEGIRKGREGSEDRKEREGKDIC